MLEFLTTRDLRDGPPFGGRIATDNVEVDRDGGRCERLERRSILLDLVGSEVSLVSGNLLLGGMGGTSPVAVC